MLDCYFLSYVCGRNLIECSQYVLGIGDATWTNFGWPRWQLVLCLALAWIIAFFCLSQGIKSAGKVVYFTALFPYVMLTAILVKFLLIVHHALCSMHACKKKSKNFFDFQLYFQIRGVTLPGAETGILFYVKPDWSRLLNANVWGDAASQIFYSFGLASNSLVSFASYCKVRFIHFSFRFHETSPRIHHNHK